MLEFRPATADDALFIARGFHMAMLFDDTPEERIRQFAEHVCRRTDVLYSAPNTLIATVDGQPAGMVTAYDGRYYRAWRERTFDIVRRLWGTTFPGMEDEATPGEFYIDSLAVWPDFRGQGIGRALLRAAMQRASDLGIPTVTIAVDPDNPRAANLYASLGFQPAGDLFIFGHTYHKMARPASFDADFDLDLDSARSTSESPSPSKSRSTSKSTSRSTSTIELTSLSDPRVACFSALTEAQLRNRLEPEQGVFIAESPKVIRVALDAGYQPTALLCERRHLTGDAADIVRRMGDAPIFTGDRELLATLTGYTLTRGVLCAMRRPQPRTLADVCRGARRVVVIHGVVDSTNVGAIFRSAAALGIDAVLLTPDSCDPLNRRAVRVSMGSVFLVPWTWLDAPIDSLHSLGFRTAAMALTDRSVSLDDPCLRQIERLAIVMGTEGDGLPHDTITAADYVVRIPMSHQVDSLNVAAAAAVAFWELRARPQ